MSYPDLPVRDVSHSANDRRRKFLKQVGASGLAASASLALPAAAWSALVTPHYIEIDTAFLNEKIGKRDVVFYAQDEESQEAFVVQQDRIFDRHSPWSTFKIPNLVIALESGVAAGLEHAKAWDQEKYPPRGYWPQAWKEDQTLRSAFKNSVVWYFKEIAQDVGLDRYRRDLVNFRYGNSQVSGEVDSFWLGEALQIAPLEQVDFLSNLLAGKLGVSERSVNALKEASRAKAKDGVVLHGKSGAGTVESGNFKGPFEGWYVGWIERAERAPLIYALYVRGEDFQSIRSFRREIAEDLLIKIGGLPANWK